MFDRPTNVPQLLRNLEIAVDSDLLAQPGFATDENLLKFFNGSLVSRKADPNIPGGTKLIEGRCPTNFSSPQRQLI
jgi:hypothetical protein